MARKKLQQLTERQLQIMDVIWERGGATVAEVHAALKRTRLARKTLATQLVRLEEQQVVRHEVEGREYVYRALVSRDQVVRAKLRSMIDYAVGGEPLTLIRYALEAEDVDPGDIERVEELLSRYRESET